MAKETRPEKCTEDKICCENAQDAEHADGGSAGSGSCGQPEAAVELQGSSAGAHSCCSERKKERGEREYKDLINRLNRIEGQIKGIRGMVERDAYCPDILIQVAAANAALNSFCKELLGSHIRTCVADDIRAGRDDTIEELVRLTQRLMK